ncbi:hypothetical protein A2U01_0049326, partial [Trifolium medium]|nr:hypothetical protein [Trifolium medium]
MPLVWFENRGVTFWYLSSALDLQRESVYMSYSLRLVRLELESRRSSESLVGSRNMPPRRAHAVPVTEDDRVERMANSMNVMAAAIT